MPFLNRLIGTQNSSTRRAAQSRSRTLAEPLETRRLLAATVIAEAPDLSSAAGKTVSVDVSAYLNDPTINTQVRFTTELGNIDLELFDQLKPISVANFLNYVRPGRYDGTIIHRATEPASGLEVLQGGGYTRENPQTRIATDPPITNEASLDPILSNARGTISYARTSDPNSATSEFFLNTVNNTNLDPSAQPPGYAVFGQIINDTLANADAIQALPTFDFSEVIAGALGELPLRNYTQANFGAQELPTANNYVTVSAITLPKLTLSATSSNPAVAAVTFTGNKLNMQFAGTLGTTDITVTGVDANGQSVSTTFTATATPPVDATVVLGAEGRKSVTFTDPNGTVATVSLKGPGTATVLVAGDPGVASTEAKGKVSVTGANLNATSIVIAGGSAATALTVTGKGGDNVFSLGSLTADSALKSISAKSVNLTGTLNVTGAISKVDLGNPVNATITLGGQPTGAPVAITLGNATATAITSGAPIKSLTATSFSPATAQADRTTIVAPSIASLTSKGAFTQNVTVDGILGKMTVGGDLSTSINASVIGTLTAKGGLNNSSVFALRTFAATEVPVGKITIGGAITNTVIRSNGNMKSITAGSVAGATVYAGIASSINFVTLPDDAADFQFQAVIGSMSVKTTTADFNLAASAIGKVSLGTVTTANNGTAFGLASGRIGSVAATIGTARLGLKNLDVPQDVIDQAGGATLEDFKIVLV
jgi:peptidyl-prolyl cis-trans isomerase A (cyclophilin A)